VKSLSRFWAVYFVMMLSSRDIGYLRQTKFSSGVHILRRRASTMMIGGCTIEHGQDERFLILLDVDFRF
jgi:hypothetical protein